MTLRMAAGALAIALGCAVGCGAGGEPSHEAVGASTNPIQGGMDDTTHNFAVGLCGGAFGGPMGGQNCQVLCSGALIAPNLVISARHCVDNVSSTTVDCSTETFGGPLAPASSYYVTTDSDVFNPSATWYQVSQIVTPTETAFCGNDLSLLVLTSNVPSSVVPVFVTPEIWRPIYAPEYSTNETAIGYGLDAPSDMASAGIRRILQYVPIRCVPNDSNPMLRCPGVSVSGVATNEFYAGNGLCEGDSGSSAYEQVNFTAGIPVSLGVLSRGGTSGNTCVGSVYTQLYPWQSLIVSTAVMAAAAGGYPAPAWTTPPVTGTDGGSSGASDSGSHDGAAADGGKLPNGSPCSSPAACASGQCAAVGPDGGGICAEPCSGGMCPMGFSCMQDFCVQSMVTGAGSSHGGGQSGGCAVGRGAGAGREPGTPALLALGLAAGLARRRRARAKAAQG